MLPAPPREGDDEGEHREAGPPTTLVAGDRRHDVDETGRLEHAECEYTSARIETTATAIALWTVHAPSLATSFALDRFLVRSFVRFYLFMQGSALSGCDPYPR